MKEKQENSQFFECMCGEHLLQTTSEINYYDNNTRFSQDFSFAMFSSYYNNEKHSFWDRLKIAWRFIKTGKMYEDQLILTETDARSLSQFIDANLVNK